MVADDRADLGVRGGREQCGAVAGVALDDVELGVGEAAGLVEDFSRRVDLADVVHERGLADRLDLVGRQVHRPGDALGVARDPAAVSVDVAVARLEQDADADESCESPGARGGGFAEHAGAHPAQPPFAPVDDEPAPEQQVGEQRVRPVPRRAQAAVPSCTAPADSASVSTRPR